MNLLRMSVYVKNSFFFFLLETEEELGSYHSKFLKTLCPRAQDAYLFFQISAILMF